MNTTKRSYKDVLLSTDSIQCPIKKNKTEHIYQENITYTYTKCKCMGSQENGYGRCVCGSDEYN